MSGEWDKVKLRQREHSQVNEENILAEANTHNMDTKAVDAIKAAKMAEVAAEQGGVEEIAESVRLAEMVKQEEHRRLIEEKAILQASLAVLDKQRDELASKIKLEYLDVYDRLRTKGQSQSVVKIERGLCQGCRIALPTQVIQTARKSESLIHCPSCSRILYAT